MKEPFIVIERGGWFHAYTSRWAWFFGREPILRARRWSNMRQAIEEMKQAEGRGKLGLTRACR